jgi:hypothetical protein
MTTFVVGRPVTTETPTVIVDAGLPVGRHRFRLEVFGSTGSVSVPAEAVVQIVDPTRAPAGIAGAATNNVG